MFGRKRKGDSGLDKIRETTDLAVDVENLVVKYVTSEETVEAVNSIDLKLKRKRTLGLVGDQLLWGAAEPVRRILKQLVA